MQKINLGIVYGGKSNEHEVSIRSAENIINAINKDKYNLFPILINKEGKWFFENVEINIIDFVKEKNIKVVFPVLHGNYGEDGSIQGLFKMINVSFVGPDVLSSAVCMDKEFTKKILNFENIKTTKFIVYKNYEKKLINFEEITEKLGLPFFVKPANSGSSVGVGKITNEKQFKEKINEAFKHDSKIIFENEIIGKEIEISVIGNNNQLFISSPGEIITTHEYYDYNAKYNDKNGTSFSIPPKDLLENKIKEIKEIARKVYQVLDCQGMARIDFFIDKNMNVIVNEVNTIPGFTNISMYPKMLIESGISYQEIIDKLITLALERYNEK